MRKETIARCREGCLSVFRQIILSITLPVLYQILVQRFWPHLPHPANIGSRWQQDEGGSLVAVCLVVSRSPSFQPIAALVCFLAGRHFLLLLVALILGLLSSATWAHIAILVRDETQETVEEEDTLSWSWLVEVRDSR